MNTYNPIKEVRALPRIRFSVRDLRASAHTILVLVSTTGEPTAVLPGQPVPQARIGAYREAYFIDAASHQLTMDGRLPSRDGAFYFSASVTYRCQVADAALVVANRCTDVAAVIEPVLRRTLLGVTRKYEPNEVADAERLANDYLFSKVPDVPGFRISDCGAEFSLDGDEAAYVRGKRVAGHRHDLDAGDLAAVRPVVESGEDGLIALYLSKHPDDAAAVVDLMRTYEHATVEQRLEALRVMFGARGGDDDFDMERVRHSIAATIADDLRGTRPSERPALSRNRLRGSLVGETADDTPGPPPATRGADGTPLDPDAGS
ncbi:MAG: hypothetical protein JWM19_6611 [Actinomycetia bacterium]|nr:hypothetical protein [Actinomycetes bacterium]